LTGPSLGRRRGLEPGENTAIAVESQLRGKSIERKPRGLHHVISGDESGLRGHVADEKKAEDEPGLFRYVVPIVLVDFRREEPQI